MRIFIVIFLLSMVFGAGYNSGYNGGNYNGGNYNGGNYNGGNYNGGNYNGGNNNNDESYSFDARDVDRDENITTKKIGYDFNITVFEKDNKEFSGTLYCVLQENDNNISDVNKTQWDSESEKNITIANIKKISKDSYIYIKWETTTDSSSSGNGLMQGNDDSDSSTTSGENNSTDHLSIRPTKYLFDIPDVIYAGESYNIEINATDDNDNNQSYNQTLYDTDDRNATVLYQDNTEETNIKLEFDDNGIATLDDFNITDVGLYRLELNDTNWTAIDKDDGTKESDRTIYGEKNITVYPYSFKFVIDTNTSTSKEWLYHSQEYNYTLKGIIQAVNKQGDVTKHFDADKNATDVNITLELNFTKVDDNELNLTYQKIENQSSTIETFVIENGIKEINFTIKDSNFTDGNSSVFGFSAYINKKIDTPTSPIDMNVTEINGTNGLEKEVNITKLDDNITFYYPRLNVNDILTSQKEINDTLNVIVYDKNSQDAENRNLGKLVLINWYKFSNDTDSNISNKIMKIDSNMNSDNIDINLTIWKIQNSDINLTIDNNTTPKTSYGVIHLDTPKYLWYSKFNEAYSYSDDSNCINHYCITYEYKGEDVLDEVGSGSFSGSEVNNTLDINSSHKGIRVYR